MKTKLKTIIKIILINILILFVGIFLIFLSYEIYLRNKLSDPNQIKTVIDQPIYVSDLDLGWFHKTNFDFDYFGGKSHLNIFGQRSADNPKAKNRILMLGDSFTFGMNVAQNQTMSAILESQLNQQPNSKNADWDVQNAGVIGYSIRQELIYLKREFNKLKPQIVVLNVFVGNDLTEQRRSTVTRDAQGYPIKIEDKEVLVRDGILSSRTPLPFNSLAIADLMQRYKTYMMNKNAYPGYIWAVFLDKDNPHYPSDMEALWQEYEQDLVHMQKFLTEKNVKFLVNIIPMDVQVDKSYWTKYPNRVFGDKEFVLDLPQKHFEEICSKNKLNCLDLLPILRKNTAQQLYFIAADPHFDVAGNKVAAENIYQQLLNFIN